MPYNFQMNDLDPDVKYLFDTVGITESHLQDGDTAAFIYEFIEKHGGVDALKHAHQSTLDSSPLRSPAPPLPPAQRHSARRSSESGDTLHLGRLFYLNNVSNKASLWYIIICFMNVKHSQTLLTCTWNYI